MQAREFSNNKGNPVALRLGMSWLALDDMPRFSTHASVNQRLEEIRAAGYDGVQWDVKYSNEHLKLCRELGLDLLASARINTPEEADALTERLAGDGFTCATVHAGWGMEDAEQAGRLIEAMLGASDRFRFPLYIETHRATIFQDIRRTVDFLQRYPDVRINGDFSHWYTGQEFVYGGFEKKMQFIEPVLKRVRFLHGRIGNPGCMQVDIGDGSEDEHPYVAHFRALWTRAMQHFLRQAAPGADLYFVPELLSPRIWYGRRFEGAEESDRWSQSLCLCTIARECFAHAEGMLDNMLRWLGLEIQRNS